MAINYQYIYSTIYTRCRLVWVAANENEEQLNGAATKIDSVGVVADVLWMVHDS